MTHPSLENTQLALPISLLRTREKVMDRFRPMLAAHGVTEQQWRVLRILEEAGEMDATTLADRACLMLPSLTRIMRTLTGHGWTASRKDPQDARRALLTITDAGRRFLADAAPESAAIYDDIETLIGAQKMQQLQQLLLEVQGALAR